MKLPLSELNLLLITLLSVATVLILLLVLKIRALQKESEQLRHEDKEDARVLFLNSRYASMGETIGNIAHQWKQPLNAIGTIQNSIKAALIFQGEISKEKLLYSVETSFKLLQHLAETIDTFYSFLAQQHNENRNFLISDELYTIRKITEYSFENSHIQLIFDMQSNPTIQGNPNEFTHALLNLILNAKDAFDTAGSDDPLIMVRVLGGEKSCTITVTDNAGGIRLKPIEMVFDLHITTKEKGSGLGLYMTKKIIKERFGGAIEVENKKEGACFTITLPYTEYGEHVADTLTPENRLSLERINQLTRKVIELEEVEKSLKKWADIFKKAHWAIALHVGIKNNFDLTNDAFNNLYGYTAEELKNISVPDLFTPESLPILATIQKKAFEKGYAAFESIHKRKDGSTFPVSVELIAIKNDEGEILYRIANIWDMSEKKAAEENLLLKEFALNTINEAVYLIDEESMFHYVNNEACEALGYTKEELLTMGVIHTDPNCTREWWKNHWAALKEHKNMLVESSHRRKDGTLFPIEVSINYFEYNGIEYNLAIVRDITQRLQLEAQKENERMRYFFERQLVGMAITSPEHEWLHSNEKLQQMLGYTHEELSALTWTEMTYPEDLASDVEQFERLLRGEIEDYTLEKRFIRKDGSIVYTNLAISCVRHDDRTVNYVLALLENITERKAAQEALAAKEEQFRTLVENLPDNIIRYDKECRAIYVSPTMERVIGHQAVAHLMGITPIESDPEDAFDSARYQQTLEQVLNSGEIAEIETEIPSPSGKREFHLIRFVAERDSKGGICGAIIIGRDITEKREAEKTLEMFGQALSHASESIFITDENTLHFIFVNDTAAKTLEYSKEELTGGMGVADIDPGVDMGILTQIMQEIKTKGAVNIESSHRSKSGRVYPIDVASHYFEYEGKGYFLAITRDITERKELEALLEKERKFLTDAQRVAHTGSWYLDIVRGVLTWSDESYRIFEFDKENINDLHKAFYECVHPDDREMVSAPYAETLKTKQSYKIEHRIVMRDGRIKYVIENCEHGYDHDGTPLYSIGTVQDITARKAMEDNLREALEFKEGIISAIPDLLFEIAPDGTYIGIWTQDDALLAVQKEMMIGKNFKEILPPDTVILLIEALQEVDEKGFSLGKTYTLDLPNGIQWFELSISKKKISGNYIVLSRDITQRKMAEESLKSNRNLLHTILESSPGIITFALDKNYRYIAFDSKHAEVIKTIFDKEIALGMNMLELITPDADREVAQRSFDRALGGENFIAEEEYGEERFSRHYWQIFYAPIHSERGEIIGFACFNMDITERREQEELLRQKEQVSRALINNLPGYVYTLKLTPEGEMNFTYLSAGVAEIYGLNTEDTLGDMVATIHKSIHPDDLQEIEAKIIQSSQELTPFFVLYRIHHPVDGEKWLEARSVPEKLEDGTIVWHGIVLDATERKNAEEAIKNLNETLEKRVYERTCQLQEAVKTLHKEITERKEAEKQLKLVDSAVNSSSEAIYISDLNLSILYVNDGACRMLGYTREELTSMKLVDIDANFSENQILDIHENSVRNQQTFFETKHRTKRGEVIDVEIVGNPFVYEGREAMISVVKEISERKKIEVLQKERLALEERLSKIAATVPGVNYIFEKTLQGIVRFTYLAPTFEELFGLSSDMVMDDFAVVMKHVHSDDQETVRQSIVTTAQNLTNWHEEFRFIHLKKGVIWIEGQSLPEVQSDGSILWYGFFHDTTERKRTIRSSSD